MALKISDLSVGDWVRVINQFNAQIDGYHSGSGSLSLKTRQGNLVYYRLEDIEPIPITAEILGEIGFGKKTFTQDQLLRIVEPNGNMPFIGYRWDSRRLIIERSNDYMLRVKAEYIHQLQRAMRLAGVDKEINL